MQTPDGKFGFFLLTVHKKGKQLFWTIALNTGRNGAEDVFQDADMEPLTDSNENIPPAANHSKDSTTPSSITKRNPESPKKI